MAKNLKRDTGTDIGVTPDGSGQEAAPIDAGAPVIESNTSGSAGNKDGNAQNLRPPQKPWPAIDWSGMDDAADAEIVNRMKLKYGTTLVTDMDDAQMLLSYLTRNGLQEEKKIPNETIQTLITARCDMRDGTFDCKKSEAEFRKNYGTMAKAALPVTVASLRDSLPTTRQRRWTLFMEPEPRSTAERACFKYRDIALIVLLLLLGFQIYWTMASSVLAKTDALISETNKAPTKEFYLAQEKARLQAIQAATGVNNPQPAPSSAAAIPTIGSETKADKTQLSLDELVSKIAELNANYSLLGKWLRPFSKLFFVPENKGTEKEETANVAGPRDIFAPSKFQNNSASIRAVGGQIVEVMQKWFLPLLYGSLGALVFVVRTLSIQARDRLFRKEGLVSLNLRVVLGAISGLAIGWFWTRNPQPTDGATPTSISTLSPFALAFVAGYSVELFFTLLDKITSTFTNK
jgi:hypothetical protein